MSNRPDPESLLSLIAQAYDAAIDEGDWAEFLDRLGEFDADERAGAALLPHLERACQMHRRLRMGEQTASSLMTTLDRLSMGVLILDRHGRVTHRNRPGSALHGKRSALWTDPDGRPRARLRHEDNVLQRLIADATNPQGAGTGGSVALHGEVAGTLLHVRVDRLGARAAPAAVGGEAVIFFSDPGAPLRASERHLGALFGFTPAQAKLVSALVASETIGNYAQRTGINLETARSHLNQSFAKAGVRRQQELISQVLRSPLSIAPTDPP